MFGDDKPILNFEHQSLKSLDKSKFKERMLNFQKNSQNYKFVNGFGDYKPVLSFNHASQCTLLLESDANPLGFKTSEECLKTIIGLREWAGLEPIDFEKEEAAVNQGFGFKNALKCRWSRDLASIKEDQEWNQTLKECLDTIQSRRIAFGLESFNNEEMEIFQEPRHTNQENVVEPLIIYPNRIDWNEDLFLPDQKVTKEITHSTSI